MRVHHLSCGTLCPMCQKLINGTGSYFRAAKMICHTLLIESKDGLILVDTGFGHGDIQNPSQLGGAFLAMVRPQFNPVDTALSQVLALGFKASEVRHIILTHLDLDHAGGLPDFPEATVHIYRPEYEAAMHPTFREKPRYRPAHFAHQPRWKIHDDAGESWFGFDGVKPIEAVGDEVLLVPLIGHTRGHCGIAVKCDDGWLLHAGDAYFYHGQMQAQPHCTPGLAVFQRLVAIDNEQRLYNLDRLHQLVQNHSDQVRINCAHDIVEFARDTA